jgi:nitrous oxide reductase
MSTLSRRNFLYAGGAAAGVAAASAAALATPVGHLVASPGRAEAAAPVSEVWEPEGVDQLVLYVSNTGSGEVTVLTDGHEVVFHDKQLVARVQRAAKTASV